MGLFVYFWELLATATRAGIVSRNRRLLKRIVEALSSLTCPITSTRRDVALVCRSFNKDTGTRLKAAFPRDPNHLSLHLRRAALYPAELRARSALIADGTHRGNGVGGLSRMAQHRYPFSRWVTLTPICKENRRSCAGS